MSSTKRVVCGKNFRGSTLSLSDIPLRRHRKIIRIWLEFVRKTQHLRAIKIGIETRIDVIYPQRPQLSRCIIYLASGTDTRESASTYPLCVLFLKVPAAYSALRSARSRPDLAQQNPSYPSVDVNYSSNLLTE